MPASQAETDFNAMMTAADALLAAWGTASASRAAAIAAAPSNYGGQVHGAEREGKERMTLLILKKLAGAWADIDPLLTKHMTGPAGFSISELSTQETNMLRAVTGMQP